MFEHCHAPTVVFSHSYTLTQDSPASLSPNLGSCHTHAPMLPASQVFLASCTLGSSHTSVFTLSQKTHMVSSMLAWRLVKAIHACTWTPVCSGTPTRGPEGPRSGTRTAGSGGGMLGDTHPRAQGPCLGTCTTGSGARSATCTAGLGGALGDVHLQARGHAPWARGCGTVYSGLGPNWACLCLLLPLPRPGHTLTHGATGVNTRWRCQALGGGGAGGQVRPRTWHDTR